MVTLPVPVLLSTEPTATEPALAIAETVPAEVKEAEPLMPLTAEIVRLLPAPMLDALLRATLEADDVNEIAPAELNEVPLNAFNELTVMPPLPVLLSTAPSVTAPALEPMVIAPVDNTVGLPITFPEAEILIVPLPLLLSTLVVVTVEPVDVNDMAPADLNVPPLKA